MSVVNRANDFTQRNVMMCAQTLSFSTSNTSGTLSATLSVRWR